MNWSETWFQKTGALMTTAEARSACAQAPSELLDDPLDINFYRHGRQVALSLRTMILGGEPQEVAEINEPATCHELVSWLIGFSTVDVDNLNEEGKGEQTC